MGLHGAHRSVLHRSFPKHILSPYESLRFVLNITIHSLLNGFYCSEDGQCVLFSMNGKDWFKILLLLSDSMISIAQVMDVVPFFFLVYLYVSIFRFSVFGKWHKFSRLRPLQQ